MSGEQVDHCFSRSAPGLVACSAMNASVLLYLGQETGWRFPADADLDVGGGAGASGFAAGPGSTPS